MTDTDVRCSPAPDGWRCEVTLGPGTASRHDVTVSSADAERLSAAGGEADVERLVFETFEFLLERESASAILRAFDLRVVNDYFPDFDAEMTHRLAT
ncbi:MAG: hypothetical protein ACSLFN_11975 [Candidatus Limnocylindrales bacterium]